jgi:hypothetical protein
MNAFLTMKADESADRSGSCESRFRSELPLSFWGLKIVEGT